MERTHERFPLTGGDAARFLGSYAVFCVIGVAIGELIVHPLRHTWVQRTDQHIEEALARHRTRTLNDLTFVGSQLSDTFTKIALTAIVVVVMWLVWRRWREPLLVACSLMLEAASFITITWIVDRPRPQVSRLEGSPVGSSFPSGHVAAAVVYGAMVIVLFWHSRARWARVLGVTAVVLIVAAVGYSRMYRGMHHLTDSLAGLALGVAALAVTVRIITSAEARDEERVEAAACS